MKKSISPNKVERTSRQVLEHKLLEALEADDVVAVLFSKQDLEDVIASLRGYVIGGREGNILTWEAHDARKKNLADGMAQLLKEAFPHGN